MFGGGIDISGWQRLANLIWFPEVDSTNAVGRGLIDHVLREEVDLAPTVVAAGSQTSGRGRRERTWESPGGGVYATFVFRLPEEARLAHLPLAAAVWVAEAASRAVGVETRLKWPNDVLCGARKLAGILTEAKTRGEETHAAVGIGVNGLGAADRFGGAATTLESEAGAPLSLADFFGELCLACDRYLAEPAASRVVAEWLARSRHAEGDELRVSVDDGSPREVVGRFAGLTDDGLLRLRTGGSEYVVASGEVRTW